MFNGARVAKIIILRYNKMALSLRVVCSSDFQARRRAVERLRMRQARELRQNLRDTVNREVDSVKDLLKKLVPFEVKVNEEAVKRLAEYSPIVIEKKKDISTDV